MKSSKICGASVNVRPSRRSALLGAAVGMGVAAAATSSPAALTVWDFTTGHGLDASANYTPATLPSTSGSLLDVTGNSTNFISATSSAKTAAASFSVGAIAIDETMIGPTAGTYTTLYLEGNDVSTSTAGIVTTLNLVGGNTGTTAGTGTNGTTTVNVPATNANDIFTVTNNFPAGDNVFVEGGSDSYLVVNVGSTGGNFDIANGGTVTFSYDTVSTVNYTATISGSGNIGVTGGGTLRLLNSSTNTGGYTISGGSTISMTANGPDLGTAPTAAPQILYNGGTLTLTGSFTTTPLGAARVMAFNGGTTNNINIGTGLTDDIAGPFEDGTVAGGSFNKIGPGTVIISSGQNTLTGGVNVSAGSLLVDSSLLTSSGISVASGATLGGIGSVPAITTVSGSIVSPGDPTTYGSSTGTGNGTSNTSAAHTGAAAGTLTAVSLSMASGSTYNYDLESTTNDLLTLTGAAGVTGGGGVFNLYQSGTTNPVDPGTYDLISFTGGGTYNGSLSSLTLGNLSYATYSFEIDPTNQDLAVVITAVPEPVSTGLLGLAAMAGLARRRRNV